MPIRIEIGPRDMEKNEVTVARRDTLEKQTCKRTNLVSFLNSLSEKMTEDLRQKAWQWTQQHVYHANTLEEARKLLEKHAGVVEVGLCRKTVCGHKLEEVTNARVLGVPEDSKSKDHWNMHSLRRKGGRRCKDCSCVLSPNSFSF